MPFCLYDCDIPVQGAVAIVLTLADRARDLKPKPAYLAGYGQRLHFEVAGRIGSLSSYMEGGGVRAACPACHIGPCGHQEVFNTEDGRRATKDHGDRRWAPRAERH